MKKVHKDIVEKLERVSGSGSYEQATDRYTGSAHVFHVVSAKELHAIVKEWQREHKETPPEDAVALIDRLMHGRSHEEKTIGALILKRRADARAAATFADLDRWLSKLIGWAEIDAFCFNVYTYEEMLSDWNAWKRFLVKLSKDTNINKRRASLVYLTHPTSKSDDDRFHELSYELVERLKHEKDILITKAISWLLRSMTDSKKHEVAAYVEKNADLLPKVAVRETRKKITTGKKN